MRRSLCEALAVSHWPHRQHWYSVRRQCVRPACNVTQPEVAEPAKDPNADAFLERGGTPTRIGPFGLAGSGELREGGNSVLWFRPQDAQLKIQRRRLDSESPPLVAYILAGYPIGVQLT